MSLRSPRRLVAAAAVPAVLAGVVVAAPATAAPAAEDPKYKGASFALQTKVSIGGETLLDLMLPDIVTFPSGGDKNLLGLPDELADLATLKVLNASADVKNAKLVANSSTAGLSVLSDVIGARVLNSDCVADKLKVTGDSEVAGLTLLGTKVPVDAGPNFTIEIPKELEALISGGITIDEQNKLDDGGLQVRALHVELVIAPDALSAALKSALASVRAVAEQVLTVVESATGQSLDSLLATTDAATGKAAKASGGAKADRSARSETAGAKQAKHAKAEKAEAGETVAKATAGKHRREASVAAAQTAPQVAAEQAATEQSATVSKTDEAAVARRDAAGQADSQAALAKRAERGAKPSTVNAAEAESSDAAEQAAAARAEAATEGKAAAGQTESVDQTQVAAGAEERSTRTDLAQATEGSAAAKEQSVVDEKAEDKRAERTASLKSDGANLRAADRSTARAAAPAVKTAVNGLIALEVIVSEVNCTGAKFAVKKKQEPKRALPKTGGGGFADDIAVAGLGLLLAGSAAAFATRRRGRHSR